MKTGQSVHTVYRGNGFRISFFGVFPCKTTGNDNFFTILHVSDVYQQVVRFRIGYKFQSKIQFCFVNIVVCVVIIVCFKTICLIADRKAQIIDIVLFVDNDRGFLLFIKINQIFVKCSCSCRTGIIILTVEGIAERAASIIDIPDNHTVGTVQGMVRTVCVGPDRHLRSVECFAFGQSVDYFICQNAES